MASITTFVANYSFMNKSHSLPVTQWSLIFSTNSMEFAVEHCRWTKCNL